VERTGPDLRRVSGIRRNASKSRKRAARASLTRVSVAAARQPPIRIRARTSGSARAVSRGAGDLDEVKPAQQGGAAALPHGPQAIDHFKISEQGLDAPPPGVCLDGGGQRGIGGQQQARLGPAGAFLQLAPRTMTPLRKRGRHTVWRSRADVVRNPGRVSSATDIGVPAVWRIGSVV
jgi:hypothetical protein